METVEAFKLLWSLKIAPSAVVYVWRILLDRLPTRANLVKRGMQIMYVDCLLCLEATETCQRLFDTCKVAQKVWDKCERWAGTVIARHESILFHFQSFYLLNQRQGVDRALKGMLVSIVSEIWNHRSKVVFNGGVVDVEEIFTLA